MKPLYAASLIFGILAAVLSGVHGVGEVMQDGSPDGIYINAWGSPINGEGPCMDANNPDGGMCFPAMTILTFLPFSIVGILTIFVSIMLLILGVVAYWMKIPKAMGPLGIVYILFIVYSRNHNTEQQKDNIYLQPSPIVVTKSSKSDQTFHRFFY